MAVPQPALVVGCAGGIFGIGGLKESGGVGRVEISARIRNHVGYAACRAC